MSLLKTKSLLTGLDLAYCACHGVGRWVGLSKLPTLPSAAANISCSNDVAAGVGGAVVGGVGAGVGGGASESTVSFSIWWNSLRNEELCIPSEVPAGPALGVYMGVGTEVGERDGVGNGVGEYDLGVGAGV